MTIHLGDVPASSTLYIPFATYDANGASVTMSGLATSDILIYKNGSTTQRASTAGFTLLDTDGIDFDSVTGLHGISIDLSDNTDAGFYAVGSFYWVVISTVTVSTQTVTVVAATFRIRPAENSAAVPLVDTVRLSGTVQTARDIGASVLLSNGTGTGQVKIASGYLAITWADIAAPTTTVNLSGTTISTSQAVASVAGAVGSVTGNVGGNVAGSVASVTAGVTVTTNNDKTGYALTSGERTSVADAILDRDMSTGTDSGSTTVRTPRQALRAIRNKSAVSAGTLTVYKEDDATASWTAAVTGTAGADPITAIDPAGP